MQQQLNDVCVKIHYSAHDCGNEEHEHLMRASLMWRRSLAQRINQAMLPLVSFIHRAVAVRLLVEQQAERPAHCS